MTELAVVLLAAALVQKIIERFRDAVPGFAKLEGTWVNLVAALLGIGIAFGAGFDVLHDVTAYEWPSYIDRLVTGIGIGAGAGFFSDMAGRSGPRSA